MDQSRFTKFFANRRRPSMLSRRKSIDNGETEGTYPGCALDHHLTVNSVALCSIADASDGEMSDRRLTRKWKDSISDAFDIPPPQHRMSFSGLDDARESLRLFQQRAASKTLESWHSTVNPACRERDPRSSCHNWGSSADHEEESRFSNIQGAYGWLRRCVSITPGHHSQDSGVPKTASCKNPGDGSVVLPIPGIGIEPPKIPENTASGAAARAAAAAQNEILECVRNMRLSEPKVKRDSKSGIGIEVRDRGNDAGDVILPIVRKDPISVLPEEIMTLILSFLDASSLINAELVSQSWQASASSPHTWRSIFRNEFDPAVRNTQQKSGNVPVGASGLGRTIPGQNWKRMWRARKALHQRWLDGYAAAIYLEGHTDSVYCVQFDENKIITGSRDRTIRIWDAHTYECIKVLGVPSRNSTVTYPLLPDTGSGRGHRPFKKLFSPDDAVEPTMTSSAMFHEKSVLCLQYDDEIIVTGSSDCTLIIWDIKVGYEPIRRLRHHTAGVLDVCFDAKHIISCSKDMTVCLWDRTSGDFLRQMKGHRGPVNAIQLRGDLVVSASGDGLAKLWNLTSGLCIKEFPSRERGMACVEFSPDSRTILAGGNDQVIYQFDTNTGELVREMDGHKSLVRSLHLDSANGRIVSGSYDNSVRAYDMRTGDTIVDFTGWTTSWILSAKVDYRRIVATSQDNRAVIMDFGYQLPGVELLEA